MQRASSIRRAVLFRFHRDWITCANHVGIIRALNPGIDVWALYGGEESAEDEALGELGHLFDHWASIRGRDAQWKYQHSDLAIRSWYQEWGDQLEFDMLHFIEWDLLLLASLDELYGHVGKGAIGLTGLTRLSQIQDRWPWCIREPLGEETRRLEEYARVSLGYEGPMWACLAGGCCLPRAFLDQYAKCEIPEFGHDELRLPLFGSLWNFDLVDTGFYRNWFCPDEERLYNANDQEIEDAVIREELHLPGGRRAFHPYRRQRPFRDDDYAAEIMVLGDLPEVGSGQPVTLHLAVTNLGGFIWTNQPDNIRLTYRWWKDGEVVVADGLRSQLPAPIRPGERAELQLEVMGPDTDGVHVLAVDLVHEGVRWFGVDCRIDVDVRPAPSVL